MFCSQAERFLEILKTAQDAEHVKRRTSDLPLSDNDKALLNMEPMDRLTYALLALADAVHTVANERL